MITSKDMQSLRQEMLTEISLQIKMLEMRLLNKEKEKAILNWLDQKHAKHVQCNIMPDYVSNDYALDCDCKVLIRKHYNNDALHVHQQKCSKHNTNEPFEGFPV